MIGIIFIGDLKYCPYLKRYTEILESTNTEFEVLYWNREGVKNDYPSNYSGYEKKSRLKKSLLKKAFDFMGYKFWLNKKLIMGKYKKLIVLSTLSGIVSFEILISKYRKNYLFDIRDYSYEHNRLFYLIEKSIIRNSDFTCISSDGFREFLPSEYDYVNVHNFNRKDIEKKDFFRKKTKTEPLNLVWMGAVRYFNHQKLVLDALQNDFRFNIVYHGSGADLEEYINYCSAKNIKNVTFTGAYDNSSKSKLIESADIINNSYLTSKFMEVKYAVSNKYYDGLIYKIPQLVEKGTYKYNKAKANGVGIGLNPNDKFFGDKLFEFYHSLDERIFTENCKVELEQIIKEDDEFICKIEKFIAKRI